MFGFLNNFFIQKLPLLYRVKVLVSIYFLNNFCTIFESFPQAKGRVKICLVHGDFKSFRHTGGQKQSFHMFANFTISRSENKVGG